MRKIGKQELRLVNDPLRESLLIRTQKQEGNTKTIFQIEIHVIITLEMHQKN